MLWAQTTPWTLLIDISPFSNTDQRIMGLINFRLGEIDIIGGHQGQIHRIGHFNQTAFAEPFGLGHAPILAWMPLQLHIQAITKGAGQIFK